MGCVWGVGGRGVSAVFMALLPGMEGTNNTKGRTKIVMTRCRGNQYRCTFTECTKELAQYYLYEN